MQIPCQLIERGRKEKWIIMGVVEYECKGSREYYVQFMISPSATFLCNTMLPKSRSTYVLNFLNFSCNVYIFKTCPMPWFYIVSHIYLLILHGYWFAFRYRQSLSRSHIRVFYISSTTFNDISLEMDPVTGGGGSSRNSSGISSGTRASNSNNNDYNNSNLETGRETV